MKLHELEYDLPSELVAHYPASPRDSARLLVLDRKNGSLKDSHFYDINSLLKAGDVLVFNKTKVFPARIFGHSEEGKKIEIVFLRETTDRFWEVIIGGKVKEGQCIAITAKLSAKVFGPGRDIIEVNLDRNELLTQLQEYGKTPLPPYIKREATAKDAREYQTVFAENIGSAAAPTAGLHFTKRLLVQIEKMGVKVVFIDLAVGLGTFAPVKTDSVEEHPIHTEHFSVSTNCVQEINLAKKQGRRVIACGTTVCRALESAQAGGIAYATEGETNLFIYPGYKFRIIDGLITNFHTPKSSLLALVYAFAGKRNIRKAYRHAIKEKYRFYSYGDGMIII